MSTEDKLFDGFCEKTANMYAKQQFSDASVGSIRFMVYDAGGSAVDFVWVAKIGHGNFRFFASESEAVGLLVLRGIERKI